MRKPGNYREQYSFVRGDLRQREPCGRLRQPGRRQEGAEGRAVDHREQFIEEAAEPIATKRQRRTESRGIRLEDNIIVSKISIVLGKESMGSEEESA